MVVEDLAYGLHRFVSEALVPDAEALELRVHVTDLQNGQNTNGPYKGRKMNRILDGLASCALPYKTRNGGLGKAKEGVGHATAPSPAQSDLSRYHLTAWWPVVFSPPFAPSRPRQPV